MTVHGNLPNSKLDRMAEMRVKQSPSLAKSGSSPDEGKEKTPISAPFLIRNLRKMPKEEPNSVGKNLPFKYMRTKAMRAAGFRPFFHVEASSIHGLYEPHSLNVMNSTALLEMVIVVVNEVKQVKLYTPFHLITPLYKEVEEKLKKQEHLYQSQTLRQFSCSPVEIKEARKVYMCIKSTRFISKAEAYGDVSAKKRRATAKPSTEVLEMKMEDYEKEILYGCRALSSSFKDELNLSTGVHSVVLVPDNTHGFAFTGKKWMSNLKHLAQMEDYNVKASRGHTSHPRLVFSLHDARIHGGKKKAASTGVDNKHNVALIPFHARKFHTIVELETEIKKVHHGYSSKVDPNSPDVRRLCSRRKNAVKDSKVSKDPDENDKKKIKPEQYYMNFQLPRMSVRKSFYKTGIHAIPHNDADTINYLAEQDHGALISDLRKKYNHRFRTSACEIGYRNGNRSRNERFELMKYFIETNLEDMRTLFRDIITSHVFDMVSSDSITKKHSAELSVILTGYKHPENPEKAMAQRKARKPKVIRHRLKI